MHHLLCYYSNLSEFSDFSGLAPCVIQSFNQVIANKTTDFISDRIVRIKTKAPHDIIISELLRQSIKAFAGLLLMLCLRRESIFHFVVGLFTQSQKASLLHSAVMYATVFF